MRSIVGLHSYVGVVALLWAEAAYSQVSVDYSGQLSAQLAALDIGPVTLPPWPLAPFSFPPSPNAIGREWGQAAAAPTYRIGDSAFGLQLDVYSNENTAYAGRRGAVAFDEANLNLTRIKPATPLSFEELALFYAGSFGRLEIGYGPGVSERTAVTGPHDYGVGSFAGDFPYFLQNPQDVGFDTISAYGSANTSPRLLYMSPRVYGLQLGATYQPDTRDTGADFTYGEKSLGIIGREPTATGTYEAVSAGFINVVEGGLNYDATFGGVRIQASLAGIRGDAAPSPTGAPFHGLTSYQAGFQLGYGDWSIGGAPSPREPAATPKPRRFASDKSNTISKGAYNMRRDAGHSAPALFIRRTRATPRSARTASCISIPPASDIGLPGISTSAWNWTRSKPSRPTSATTPPTWRSSNCGMRSPARIRGRADKPASPPPHLRRTLPIAKRGLRLRAAETMVRRLQAP